MKTTITIGRQWQVLLALLCGMSFYAFLIVSIYLIGGLVIGSIAHAWS